MTKGPLKGDWNGKIEAKLRAFKPTPFPVKTRERMGEMSE